MAQEQRFITITPWAAETTNTGFVTPAAINTGYIGGAHRISSGSQNDQLTYTIDVPSGTYTITMVHQKDLNRGIYTIKINGASAGTIDGYNAVSLGSVDSLTGVVIAAPLTLTTLQVIMATKNGSSSNYYAVFGYLSLHRTA